jgi:hypothetical protein
MKVDLLHRLHATKAGDAVVLTLPSTERLFLNIEEQVMQTARVKHPCVFGPATPSSLPGRRYMRICGRASGIFVLLIVAGLLSWASSPAEAAVRVEGQVQAGGKAVAGSLVSLWAASSNAPAHLVDRI